MICEEDIETRESLFKVNKVCQRISTLLKILFVIFCACWIFAAFFMALSFSSQEYDRIIVNVVLHLIRGLVIAALFVVLIGMFSDAARGESPFKMDQVKRLRLISCFLVIYGILEMIFSVNAAVTYYEGINAGFFSTDDSAIITVNFAPFIAAAVVFAFSFVFKYGVLLQEFSDESI